MGTAPSYTFEAASIAGQSVESVLSVRQNDLHDLLTFPVPLFDGYARLYHTGIDNHINKRGPVSTLLRPLVSSQ